MLESVPYNLGYFTGLYLLLAAIAAPAFLVWAIVRFLRDLRRMRDSLCIIAALAQSNDAVHSSDPFHSETARRHSVSNSAFGR
jgi:hypothetical protein